MPNTISIKLLCNYIEITLWQGCSPVNLLHVFRTHFAKNTSKGLLLFDIILNDISDMKTIINHFVKS